MPGRRALFHEFDAGVPELPQARAVLRRWLEKTVRNSVARQDLLLAGTELCTEAVQRRPGATVALRAWVEGGSVVLEVVGPADPPVDSSVPVLADSRSDARCRTHILEQICDEVSRTTDGAVRAVRCRRHTGRP